MALKINKTAFIVVVTFLSTTVAAIAQTTSVPEVDTLWKKAIQAGLNLNQASFSDNWKGGGTNSISLGVFLNAKSNYETDKISFDNVLQTQYGVVKNQGQGMRKNSDRIFFDSKLGYKLKPKWDLFISVNYMSQFAPGYNYGIDTLGNENKILISRFMSPGYLTSSLGLEYRPVEYFWMRFGAGSVRQTFVLDTTVYHGVPKNYGVPIGKKVRNEVAFQFIANFDKNIAKNISLKARYMAFANYETLRAIDSRLDVSLTARVTKIVNVNLTGTVLYDEDMDYKIQYTQALSLGILINYNEFKDK